MSYENHNREMILNNKGRERRGDMGRGGGGGYSRLRLESFSLFLQKCLELEEGGLELLVLCVEPVLLCAELVGKRGGHTQLLVFSLELLVVFDIQYYFSD